MFNEPSQHVPPESSSELSSVQLNLLRAAEKLQTQQEQLPDTTLLVQQGIELLKAFPTLRGNETSVAGMQRDTKISPAEEVERFFEQLRDLLSKKVWITETQQEIQELQRRLEAGEILTRGDLPGLNYKPSILPKSSFRSVVSSDGQFILVGKGGARNDHLTLTVAEGEHIFLHVKDYTGAHVILPYQRQAITETTMREACQLALHYSKAREQSSVQMSVACCSDIVKDKGAPDGRVRLLKEEVLSVDRDPVLLATAMTCSRTIPYTTGNHS